MSARTETPSQKPRGQDALGLALAGLGGLVAVSIVLALLGNRPTSPLLTRPVVGLMGLIGAWPALVLSVGLALTGAVLFLRDRAFAAGRPLLAWVVAALGLGLLLGAFLADAGGPLGAALPSVLPGITGKIAGFVVGLSVLFASLWLVLSATRSADVRRPVRPLREERPTPRTPEGVSAAEAAALAPLPRRADPFAARPAHDVRLSGGIPEGTRPLGNDGQNPFETREDRRPAGVGALRPAARSHAPVPPAREDLAARAPAGSRGGGARSAAPETAPLTEREEAPGVPVWERAVLEDEADESAAAVASADEDDEPVLRPRAWERVDATEEQDEGADTALLDDELDELEEDELDQDEALVDELSDADLEEDELEEEERRPVLRAVPARAPEPSTAAPPRKSWEQVGLFDEDAVAVREPLLPMEDERARPASRRAEASAVETEEELEEEREDELGASDEEELEAAWDEEADEEAEDDEDAQDESALEDDEDERAEESEEEEEADEPVLAEAPEDEAEFVLEPRAGAPDPEPGWDSLVHEAGCLILDENRVAVSMLERRFRLDFDQACQVLDVLQNKGLIGPYMGGRTREILLTRDEWMSHAP